MLLALRTNRSAFSRRLFCVASALSLVLPASAWAQSARSNAASASHSFAIPAQPLEAALQEYMQESGVQVGYESADVAGRTSGAVNGAFGPGEALSRLLSGTGLTYRFTAPTAVRLEPAPLADAGTVQLGPVRVEGDGRATGSVHSGRYAGIEETGTGPVDGYIARRSATATKTDTPIIETPQSVSVVSADRIEAIGANRIGDALAYTPGIKAINGYDTRYDWVMLRGFDAYSPGFYLDGLQLRNSANYAVWRTETYGAERVELLRGPASVLYGQNGPGGVINVVSKRPLSEPLHEIQAQIGNFSRYQIASDFGGPIGNDDRWSYRLTGLALDSDTQVDHVSDNRIYIAPAVTWRPSGNTSLTVLGHFQRLRSGTSSVFLPLAGTLLPNPNGPIRPSTFTGEPDFDRFNQDQWTLGYLFEHRFGETWTIRQNARYGELKSDFRQVYGTSFLTVDEADPASAANYRILDR